METDRISLVYFSPTGTTKKVIETIADAMSPKTILSFDLTSHSAENKEFEQLGNELAIIGVPVYSGRVPPIAVNRLKKLKADNCPAILVTVYGNCDFADALIELRDIAVEMGCKPVAAATFIGEHSFSTEGLPVAHGRPDVNDLKIAAGFGREVKCRILESNLDDINILVPGNNPYAPVEDLPPVSPVTLKSFCTMCGTCVSECPTGSIHLNGEVVTETGTCILCCACVRSCPDKARVNDNDFMRDTAEWLFLNCAERREPELFF